MKLTPTRPFSQCQTAACSRQANLDHIGSKRRRDADAIEAWYYPGGKYGEECVYAKLTAVESAEQSNKPVPTKPTEI